MKQAVRLRSLSKERREAVSSKSLHPFAIGVLVHQAVELRRVVELQLEEPALADSTTAASWPLLSRLPVSGTSAKTMSPSCSWAWSEMPTVAVSPSTRIHSCSLVK